MVFVKGDPKINREGRPPASKNFTTKVREALEKISEGGETTYEQEFIKSIMKKAIVDQDPTIMKLIWNYLDGMPSQKMDLTTNPGEGLTEEQKLKLNELLGIKNQKQSNESQGINFVARTGIIENQLDINCDKCGVKFKYSEDYNNHLELDCYKK